MVVKKSGPPQFPALMATMVGQVGCVVVLLIGLAMGGGILLDRFLETGAVFTVIFMLGTVPVALYVTVRISMSAAERAQTLFEPDETEDESDA